MKKMTYDAPKMEVVALELSKIICGSDGTNPGYGGGGEPGTNDPD